MEVFFKKDDREVRLNDFIEFINSKLKQEKFFDHTQISSEIGKKYIKIIKTEYGNQRSVYFFLDMEGNIFKAASWKAPAKHKRGSIFDENYGWGKSFGPYGASYLR